MSDASYLPPVSNAKRYCKSLFPRLQRTSILVSSSPLDNELCLWQLILVELFVAVYFLRLYGFLQIFKLDFSLFNVFNGGKYIAELLF